MTINEIAQHLHKLMEEANERAKRADEYKEQLESLIATLEWHIEEAKAFHEEMKNKGLTVNTIEAEGALRLALLIGDELTGYKK